MHRRIAAVLCWVAIITIFLTPEGNAVPRLPSDWMPIVFTYALHHQYFYWQRLDEEHGRLVMNLGGSNYGIVTGQSLGITGTSFKTRGCLGDPIDVHTAANEYYNLPKSKKSSPIETVFGLALDKYKDQEIERMPAGRPKVWLRSFSFLITVL